MHIKISHSFAITSITCLLIGFFLFLSLALFAQASPNGIAGQDCPRTGNGKNPTLRASDSLKNRSALKPVIADGLSLPRPDPQSIPIDSILAPNNDLNRFSDTIYASLTGYVVKVKYGGPESCNCKSANKADWDYHIVVAADSLHTKRTQCMIIEVTRYNRQDNPALTYAYCKSLVGHKATFTGWMFRDMEHWNAAENTHPGGAHNWRATVWELHSIANIDIVKN